MLKKILGLSVMFVLCNFSTPGQTGCYIKAFESEVTSNGCRSLACQNLVNEGGGFTTFTYQGSVEVGHSVGPLGTTRHYEQRPKTSSYQNLDSFVCALCRQRFGQSRTVSTPIVSFRNVDNTRVMNIKNPCCTDLRSPCEKPQLDEDLAAIVERAGTTSYSWEDHLERLWKAARYLDSLALSGKSQEDYDWEQRLKRANGKGEDEDGQTYGITTSTEYCCILL